MTADEKHIILIVDDEEMVTTSLRSFLELETDYEVVTFTSPIEALEYVRENPIDLIVSDYLMPDVDGISLLLQIKQLRPNATRVLLTGYADKENAIKAINDVGLYQYIEKLGERRSQIGHPERPGAFRPAAPTDVQDRRGGKGPWRADGHPE